MVLSERSRREEIIVKMAGKTQESVLEVLDKLERKYGKDFKEKFKTITVDNGSEFLDHKGIERFPEKDTIREMGYLVFQN